MVEVSFKPTTKLIVHDVLEYTFDDLIQEYIDEAEVGGPTIKTLTWANGVVFNHFLFNSSSALLDRDALNGIVHYSSVTFALKEKFEKQIIRRNTTLNFIDDSEIQIYHDLAIALKERSRYKK